jgi:UDP-N-acetylmuramoyl-tripeptide--D-alanyl-D-alanine ligase
VVLEMGARKVGDIKQLAEVARPDVGVVTRVAKAHVAYFGDLDGVARAKGELVAALPASGLAVLNFDDPPPSPRHGVVQRLSGAGVRDGC